MPEFTDYQNLELPEPFNVNERNQWGRILNDALDEIDDKLIRSGPLTDRPEAQVEGRLFLDTNSGTLYRDDGNTWQQFGSQTNIQESQATRSVNPNVINFDRGFTVTEPTFRTAKIDIEDIFIENSGDTMEGVLDMGSNDLVDAAQTIWDTSAQEVPDSALGQINNSTLVNDSVTVTTGDGLKNGGTVSLGSSTTVDIEPSDFAGLFLQDDGSDNLAVLIGRGLENDGSGNIRVDEDTAYNFQNTIDFNGGLQTTGDIVNGSQVIWDESVGEIPDAAMGSIDNSTLTNSSLSFVAGDGLTGGGTVSLGSSATLNIEPNDFAGSFLQDEGGDDLGVLIGRGLENDGSGNIRVDEDTAYNFTDTIDFNSGLTLGGQLSASSNRIRGLPEPINPDEAARKTYVDSVAQGLDLKNSCVAANETNIDLTSSTDPNPIDGHTITDGERVLLKSQSDGTENGIYIANTATDPTTWTRSPDADDDSEITNGTFTFVENGTNNGNSSFIVTSSDPITLGSTVIEWSPFSTAGEIEAGDGLTKSGLRLDADVTEGLEFTGNAIRVDEDFDFTFTSKIDAPGGIDLGPSGDLDNVNGIEMDGDISGVGVDINITEVGSIVGPKNGDTSLQLSTQGDGSHDITLRDGFNGADIAKFNEGGSFEVFGGAYFKGNTSQISVTGGNDLNFNRSDNSFINFSQSGSGGSLWVRDSNNNPVVKFIDGGQLEVNNGDITSGDTNSALEIDEQASIGDTGKVQLSRDARPQGYAMIQDVTNDQSAMVYLGGAADTVEILHDSGAGNEFTTVEDNNGTTNIYYDSGNNRYEINNETGGSATYSFQILKA